MAVPIVDQSEHYFYDFVENIVDRNIGEKPSFRIEGNKFRITKQQGKEEIISFDEEFFRKIAPVLGFEKSQWPEHEKFQVGTDLKLYYSNIHEILFIKYKLGDEPRKTCIPVSYENLPVILQLFRNTVRCELI